ncbi:MAG TPA: hypothetical protein EYQ69_06865 [Gemmatimonadetes bacterium]|nr:hypothetical protein [Gemmatimonadota bacterium]
MIASLCVTAVVGWFFGPTLANGIEGILSDQRSIIQGSPEIAAAAMERMDNFQQDVSGMLLSFSAEEVASLILHSGAALLPDGTVGFRLEMAEGGAIARTRVSTSDFPDLMKPREIPAFLPDTVSISIEGSLIPLTEKEIGFAIYGAQISFIPLPSQIIPQVLLFFGIEVQDGYPGSVFRIPLPNGISGAYILHDRLFLVR